MRKKEEVKTLSMIMTLSGTSYYYGEHTHHLARFPDPLAFGSGSGNLANSALRPLNETGKHSQIFIVHITDFIRLFYHF